MDSKENILFTNCACAMLVFPLLEDLQSAPLVSPVSGGGNHAHWILGHLVVSEGQFRVTMEGGENPNESLKSFFSGGSQPSPDASGYPAYGDLLQQFKSMHEANLAWMQSLSESDLDQPSKMVRPGFEAFFGTWRQVLSMRPLHWMNHRGQLADCRRAAGRAPIMA